MLKATAGGGGRGIRMVASAADLEDAFQRTSDEALRAFGNGTVFLERLVTGARHVEVQLIADSHGTAWALGVRDCSIQRRNQKVIEESASPLLVPEQAEELKASAERLALAVGYVGAGTVEFLYHPGDRSFAFLEVNTRLQVEHSITEATTGVDLVKAQILVARRRPSRGRAKPGESGHAVEARLNAEDPDRDFAPAPGRIVQLDLPAGPGVRVDTGVAEGDTIPPDFDSMIAKIIAYGRTRDEALARLRRAMTETTVVIEGGACNKSFVLDLLAQPEVVDGTGGWADTGWIDRVRAEGRLVAHAHAGIAVVACGHRGLPRRGRARGRAGCSRPRTAADRRPSTRPAGRSSSSSAAPPTRSRPSTPARRATGEVAAVAATPRPSRSSSTGTRRVPPAARRRRSTAPRRHRHPRPDHPRRGRRRRPPRHPGRGRRAALAGPGARGGHTRRRRRRGRGGRPGHRARVDEDGDGRSTRRSAARVKDLLVTTGSQVETGTPLDAVSSRSATRTGRGGRRRPVRRSTCPQAAEDRPPAERRVPGPAATSRAVVLGYDVPPADQDAALSRVPRRARRGAGRRGSRSLDDELALLGTFADLAELSRNRPADEERHTELRVHSSREHFHTYLQSLDVERGGLPGALPRPAGAGAAPLRRRGPRAHARAGGGGLPHLPGPAALGARGRDRHRPARLLDRASRRRPATLAAHARASCWNGSVASPSCASR